MAYVGVCGTDVHFYDDGHIDRFVVQEPLTLGHEMSGVISKVGDNVRGFKPGDRVTIDTNRPCFQCKNCQDRRFNICTYGRFAGLPPVDGGYARFMVTPVYTCHKRYLYLIVTQPGDRVTIDTNRPCFQCKNCQDRRFNICTYGRFAGMPPVDGGYARFMVIPVYTCHKLPENVSLQAGACMEPLSVALHGLHRGKITAGEVVVVIGAGPIGLLTMQAAKAQGARKVLVVDINQQRLELAKSLGADVTFNSSGHADPEKTAEAIKEVLEDEADLGVECTGAPGTLNTAIYACRVGGRVVVLGIGEKVMNIHIGAAALREIDLIGALCNNNFPEAVALVASGKVHVLPLISHVLPLENIVGAIDLVRDGKSSIKVMIDCQK